MNYSALIHEFLEGSLSSEEEYRLLMAVASNEDLRKEFKESISIDKAFNDALPGFAPSSTQSSALFTKMGITAADLGAGAAVQTGIWSSLLNYKSQFLSAFSGLLVSSIIFFSFFYKGDNENLATISNINDTDYNTPELLLLELPKENYPSVKSGQAINHNKSNFDNSNIASNSNHIAKLPRNEESLASEDIREVNNVQELSLITNSSFTPEYKEFSLEKYQSNISTFRPVTYAVNHPKSSSKAGISIEFKGNEYWNKSGAEDLKTDIAKFANSTISLMFEGNKYISFGAEFRQEKFYQEFHGKVKDEVYEYRQFPNYYSVNFNFRGKYLVRETYSLFSQLSTGATETGVIGRLMFGMEYKPNNNYSFIFGLEGSSLFYEHQKKMFWSPKISLSYGISIKL